MKKLIYYFVAIMQFYCFAIFAQMPQMGGDFRPNYESYRLDKFIEESEASYSGELNFSIPILTVPGRHGNNFDIKISYNSNIRQRQYASWVGLGWNLEFGAVERTVNGRPDEPTHNLNFGSLGWRGNMGGRFKSDFTVDTIITRDVADQYHLLIDGGGTEIMPFNPDMYDSTYLDNQVFLPVQYKPWEIQSYLGQYSELNGFLLRKEDGTKYNYGHYSNPGNGQVEWIRVADDGVASDHQEYRFTYRWNLNSIQYPDGSMTEIEYEFQNNSSNRLYRRYDNVMIDRSQDHSSGVGNFFGKLPSCDNLCACSSPSPFGEIDSVYYEYAYPTELITDTHYLKFKTSSNTGDNTARNYRLDTLILYDKNTDIELKRIVFHFAADTNSKEYCPVNLAEWVPGERLNNNQLTLVGLTIQNGESLFPEEPQGNGEDIQKYYFTYTTNPKINPEFISRYVASGGQPEWPGYYKRATHPDLANAWRLKTITLPTGGRYTFEYENIIVNNDPAGGENSTDGWNYSSEPMSRLKSKKFEDGFDSQKIRTYSYSPEVVYDPPGYISLSSYVPSYYRYIVGVPRNEYYKWFRGCSIGHRWVKIDYPDGSWKKLYFTSSYHGTDPLESKPDFIEQTQPTGIENIFAISNAGARGMIWKEESGSGSTVSITNTNYYSFRLQGFLKDRYDFYGTHQYASTKYQYSLRTSIWAKLDSTKTTQDGVTVTTKFEYNPTIREDDDGNGLVIEQINKGNNIDKKTSYKYAYNKLQSAGMKTKGMRSQLYSTTITKAPNDDESKEFTSWNLFSNRWLPHKIYNWKGLSTDQTAPEEPTGNNVINIKTFNYDNSGYSNIISETDAYNKTTSYYYSTTSNPYENTSGGLSKGYVTGIEYPQSSPLLRESFKYDHYGNVIEKADENGNKTKATYDDLGRIASVIDPFDNEVEKFRYHLHNSNSVLSESNPNSIIAESYRSLNDFTTAKFFYCGAGFERQKLIAFGNDDIISATTYDDMWRQQKSYKPYQVNLGANKHKYDVNYHNNAIADYEFTTPYITNEYFINGTGRIKNIKPEGDAWQSHFKNYSYGANSTNSDQTIVLADGPDITATEQFTVAFTQNVTYEAVVYGGYFCVGTTPGGWDIVERKYSDASGSFHTSTGLEYFMTAITGSCPPPPHPCNYSVYGKVIYNVTPDITGLEEGAVFKTIITDENGVMHLEFIDRLGNHIQSVTDSKELKFKTVFSYNVLGNMIEVTPPNGSNYSSSYTYNTLSQLVEKTTPDAGAIKYLYDKAGNLRFIQDAKQTPTGKFTYQKYDELNRVKEVGEYTASGSFTQTNADDVDFPPASNPNKIKQKEFSYDTQALPEQRNLLGNLSRSWAYKSGNIQLISFFSYDENNRVEWILHQMSGMSDKKISYWYDWQGNITKKSVSELGGNALYTFYEYDEAGRLSKVFTNTVDSQEGGVQEAEYTYNADGTVKQLNLANAQEMNYVHNERSWLTQINHQNLYGNDKFGEVIGYNNQDHIATGTGFNFQPQYNGNISWNIMSTKGVGLEGVDAGYPDPIIGYVYNYDGANRLTKADFGYYHSTSGWSNSLPKAAMYDLPLVSYDANGNILTLQRKGVDALMMDNLTYAYQSNKNRLASITNAVNSQTYNYGYDNNGNVINDQYRDISGITYNISNLPEQLTANGSVVKYWYDNNGNRFRKQEGALDEIYVLGVNGETEAVFNADGSIKFFNINSGKETIGRFAPTPVDLYLSNTTLSGTYEATNSITVEDNVTVSGTTTLKAGNNILLKPGFHAPSGIDFTAKIGSVTNTIKRYYYLKDHLGSIRVVVDETGNIVSSDDYDPWGMILNGRSTNGSYLLAKYKFTGKERDTETGYDYFGARYYDSRIGRWLQVDPLSEKYFGWSPYNYTLNNPLKYFDPDGNEIVLSIGKNKDGSEKYVRYYNGKLYEGNKIYKGSNNFALKIQKTLNNLVSLKDSKINDIISTLQSESGRFHLISESFSGGDNVVSDDPNNSNLGEQTGSRIRVTLSGEPIEGNLPTTAESTLAHELLHSFDFDQGNRTGYFGERDIPGHLNPSEIRAVKMENRVRAKQGLDRRTTYGKEKIDKKLLDGE